MVRIDRLNMDCAKRVIARAIPAQVACRLLGNETVPCPLDPVCRPIDRYGIGWLYGGLAAVLLVGFFLGFWILRITRLTRLLGWFWGFLFPPLRFCANAANQVRHFWNDLTETL